MKEFSSGPFFGPSLTGVSKSASTLPSRESLCSRSPVSAMNVPSSACEAYE
ncbi:MAG TPA: hypothetical protein VI300_04480 [Solirubrobacter sp.]